MTKPVESRKTVAEVAKLQKSGLNSCESSYGHTGFEATSSIIAPLTVIAGLLLLYFTIAGKTKLFNDADTLWHIAIGRSMFDSGLVTQDHYSFTRYGDKWVANQWLAECLLAGFDWLGGFDGVLVLTVAVLTATYLALSRRWLLRGVDPILTLTFVALIVSASAYTINARPHIVSIGLLGSTFALLRNVEEGRARPAQLAWLVPLFALWSNLHGGVLGGLGTLGLVATGWTLLWILGAAAPVSKIRDIGVIWLCVAGCGLALFATPYGTDTLAAWRAIMSMSLPDLIIEHAPLHAASVHGMLAILLCIVYLAIFVATPGASSRPTFWLPLVWFVLTCTRIRHAPLFAIVAGVAMADLLPQSRLAPWLARHGWLKPMCPSPNTAAVEAAPAAATDGHSSQAQQRGKVGVQVATVVLLMTVPLLVASIWLKHVGPLPLVGAGWARPTARVWPADLTGPLTAYANQRSEGTPVFNEPILGGYLIYKFPKLRVFIDGRCELYGEAFLQDFVAAWRDPARVEQWQRDFGFRAALIEADSPLRSYFEKADGWRRIAESPSAVFYQRRGTEE